VRALTGIAIPTPANITAATIVISRIGIFVFLKLPDKQSNDFDATQNMLWYNSPAGPVLNEVDVGPDRFLELSRHRVLDGTAGARSVAQLRFV
jgi:hypothetical protein